MRTKHSLIIVAVLASLAVSACGRSATFDNEAASDDGPSKVEPVKGTDYARVTLTPKAAERIGLRTEPVRRRRLGPGGAARAVIPYAAVMYDAEGHAFTYASVHRLVFIRRPIRISRIDGRVAILSKGPPAGTRVVTVGVAELLGVEYGVEED
jgi:hypothetical protein